MAEKLTMRFVFSVVFRCAIITTLALALPSSSVAVEGTESASSESNGEASKGNETHGVSLGDYRIRTYYPVDAQKSTVRFTLYANVKGEHSAEAQRLVEEHKQKLRDQVITATRLAPLTIFQEPDLASFRRRVLVRIRRALPELTIEDLYVSEFDLVIKSL
jgi:hypothetical protein